jgi:hypothetical protein
VLRGDVAATQEQYVALEDPGLMVALGIKEVRLLGLLAQTMGNFDQAMAHF